MPERPAETRSPAEPGASAAVEGLFEAIRAAARPAVWSHAVQLARRQSVLREGTTEDEISFRVRSPGRAPATVFLNPADEEWECECDSVEDVCEHTAAAVIALRRSGDDEGAPLERAEARGRIGYRFEPAGRGLRLDRYRVQGSAWHPLTGSIAAFARQGQDDVELRPADFKIEEALGARPIESLNTGQMQKILRLLADLDHVRLGEQKIEVQADPVLPVVVVEDRGDGFALSVRRSPEVTRAFTNGVALCGDALRPVGDPRLTQRERDELTPERYFGPDRLQELVTEVLPSLEERLPIDRRSARLPRPTRVAPRVAIEVERIGDELRIEGVLVYGDPPLARVEGGVLRPLGDALPLRQIEQEQRLAARFRQEIGLEAGRTHRLGTEAAIELRPALEAWEGALIGHAHRDFHLGPPLEVELDLDPSSLRLGFRTTGRNGHRVEVPAAPVLDRFHSGSSFVPLPGGGFAPIPEAFLAEHGHLIADLLAAKGNRESLPSCALPDLARLCDALGHTPPPSLAPLRALLEDFTGLPPADLPAGLRVELRDYQTQGVAWLDFMRRARLGALLADDMGLGKTLQAMCALRGETLIVCPTSVLYGWADQLRRFLPEVPVSLYHGPRRTLEASGDTPFAANEATRFTLTTYALLRLDIETLASRSWDAVVLDEAQAIKNPSSQVARAAYRLDASFRMALTGTPIENRLEELWSQLHFLNPSLLGSQSDFKQRYVRPISDGDPAVARHLRQRIRPFVLRRLKRDVALSLPPRSESVLHCELSSEERSVYDAIRAATQNEVAERLRAGGSVLEVLEALLRLRQAACHPALVPGSHRASASSSKLEVLMESLEEAAAAGHRSLVFSQWTTLLDRVEPRLRESGLGFERLDGSTRDRQGVVTRFQADDGPPVLLISLRAGGTGLNLTAADHVFLLDPWWNPAVEDQAADRVHRIGQERPVSIYRLVAIDTVEERILALQQRKRSLSDTALGDAGGAASITREELLSLLD